MLQLTLTIQEEDDLYAKEVQLKKHIESLNAQRQAATAVVSNAKDVCS
jgi:hypothetical protein